jgi:hypothetical protein
MGVNIFVAFFYIFTDVKPAALSWLGPPSAMSKTSKT